MKSSHFLAALAVIVLAGCQTATPDSTPAADLSPIATESQTALPMPPSPPPVPDTLPPSDPLVSPSVTDDVSASPVVIDSDDETVYCTADVEQCPDGSFVARDPENNCEFEPCPGEEN